MRTLEEIRERITILGQAKEMLFQPPVLVSPDAIEEDGVIPGMVWGAGRIFHRDSVQFIPPACSLESLNAEIAALTWVLGEVVK